MRTLYDGTGAPPAPSLTKILRGASDGELFFSDSSSKPLIVGDFVQTGQRRLTEDSRQIGRRGNQRQK